MGYARGAASIALALALAGVGVGCSLLEGERSVDAGDLDAAADVQVRDASGDVNEASDDAGPDGPDAAPPSCPKDASGPPMVGVKDFCIDSTEVTNEQYEAFRAATQDAGKPLPARCTWNTDLAAQPWINPTQKSRPAGVDFCDAYMYCSWAGKHLCGGPKGAALAGSGVSVASQDLWFAACTGGGQTIYPYGNTYDSTLCAGELKKGAGTVDVGTLPQCVGGVNGLYDMSGNVSEWIDSCAGIAATDPCIAHGGDFGSPPPELQCDAGKKYPANAKDVFRGFRCCMDPQ
jgi:formylglycine-generating enzyme required for sulfatase activity